MKTLTTLTTVLLLAILTACGGAADTDAPPPADTTDAAAAGAAADAATARLEDGVQVAEIEAGTMGYSPGRIELQADVPVRLVFTRTAESPCIEQVQIPAFGVEPTPLPLNQPVAIEFTPEEAGEYSFVCGMDMIHGTLLVKS